MQMKQILLYGILTFILLSCGDERNDFLLEEDQVVAAESSSSDGFFNHIFSVAFHEIESVESKVFPAESSIILEGDACATITYYKSADSSYIENITIDYQDENCITDGRKRIGKIHVFLTGRLKEIGTEITVSMQNFHINGFKIEGTQTSVLTGLDVNYNPIISQEISNGKITVLNGDFLTFEAKKDILIDLSNQWITYSFKSEGISSKGEEFQMYSESDLLSDFDCAYIQSGVVRLQTSNSSQQSIEYGDGTCDNVATYKSGDLQVDFELN